MAKEFSKILWDFLIDEGNKGWHELVIKKIGYEVLKEHFGYRPELYDSFYAQISQSQEKLKEFHRTIKFYYFWCKRPSVFEVLRPEFKLIIMFSIIENLMGGEYMPFSDWLFSKVTEGTKISTPADFEVLLEEYYKEYGTNKKVLLFFEKYYDSQTLGELKKSIEYLDKETKELKHLEENREIVDFIISLRNLFIHKATSIQISSRKEHEEEGEGYTDFSMTLLMKVKNKIYHIDMAKVHIENLILGFEKGLIEFFK